MMAFNPTDLPIPVAPATNRWGSLVKSTINTSLVMVLPKQRGRFIFEFWNFLVFSTLSIDTI